MSGLTIVFRLFVTFYSGIILNLRVNKISTRKSHILFFQIYQLFTKFSFFLKDMFIYLRDRLRVCACGDLGRGRRGERESPSRLLAEQEAQCGP